jgi:phosphoesterase RecJ-like protein
VLNQASQLIKSACHPLLICHVAPDGDAIGSLVGLGRALCHLGVRPIMACADPIPANFAFIPDIENVVQDVDVPFDLVISLDCSDMERLGHFAEMPIFGDVPLLNIDHHLTNLRFGDVNLLDICASSTAEIVFHLLEHMAIPLDAELATCLLTGIVTDTRGFRTSNVTVQVMEVATRLMNAGASLPAIAQRGLDQRSTSAILLWREALSSLQVKDRVAWASVSLVMRHTAGHTGNGDAGLVNFLLSADDADVSAVFVEREDGCVEIGFRAMPGFDVAHVAMQFGGGGHALAAGCTVPGPLEEAQARVLPVLQDAAERASAA